MNDKHDHDNSIQESRYKWIVDKNADDYATKTMKHIVDELEKYPNMDATIMMAALNALSYQVDTEDRYKEAVVDIDALITEQILKYMPASEFAGKA